MLQRSSGRPARATSLVMALGLLAAGAAAAPAGATDRGGPGGPGAGGTTAPAGAQVVRDEAGRTRLVGAPAGHRLAAAPRGARGPAQSARRHVQRYARAFGLTASGLRTGRVVATAGGHVVHLQQTVGGVPVVAGRVAVAMDRSSALLSVSGETTRRVESARFAVPASRAALLARRATATAHGVAVAATAAPRPTRWLFDPSLVDPRATAGGARAVWRVEVGSPSDLRVRDLVLVDARSGRVALRVDMAAHLTDRVVCDGADVPAGEPDCRPGRYARTEGSPPSGVADVDQAYDHTGATADWFATRLGADLTALIGSDRGDGPKIRSTARYCPAEGCPFDNAFWTGEQMVYGTGFASADDVVAHELTHGVIEATAGLIYWFQSGAINESMADVFGELVDQADGLGTDTPDARWQLGEDLGPRAGGVTRHMATPPRYGQPDHTGSDLYDFAPDYDDNGGVHTNSGVPNKTAYLITDGTAAEPGGAFNGRAFAGIGTEKSAAVYWATLLMLTPGADFADLSAALRQACANLAGSGAAGLTAADCGSVSAATDATGLGRWAGPSVPRRVRMTGVPRGVVVTWRPPAGAGSSPLNSYAVHVRPEVGPDDFYSVEPGARRLRIDGLRPATDYVMGVVAVTADGTSRSATRSLRGTGLRVDWPGEVTYGEAVRVGGALTDAAGAGLAGRRVRLLRRAPGARAYAQVATATTGRDGELLLRTRPAQGARYRVVYDGAPRVIGARSRTVWVGVRQRVDLSVDTSVRLGDLARFSGQVGPARPGGPVRLQRRLDGGGWRTAVRGRIGPDGRYELVVRVTSRRPEVWRVLVPVRSSAGLGSGRSREVVLRVR